LNSAAVSAPGASEEQVMSMKLHAFPHSPRSFKALVVASHLGLDCEVCLCDLTKGQQKSPEYTVLNPNQKAPTLEDGALKLWESNAIIVHLAGSAPESGLLPSDPSERADVMRWLFWESTTWDPACAILAFERVVKPFLGIGAPDPVEVEKGLEKFNAAASILDEQLRGRAFVCGDSVSLADFSLAAALILEQAAQLPLASYPEIRRWSASMAALPAWSATLALQTPPSAAS
jgi:glutathione S-transferase